MLVVEVEVEVEGEEMVTVEGVGGGLFWAFNFCNSSCNTVVAGGTMVKVKWVH